MFWIVVTTALLAVGVALIFRTTREISDRNAGHRLPVLYGQFVNKPSKSTITWRGVGFFLVLLGAWRAAALAWDYRPGWSIVLLIVLILAGWSVPALAVTVRHNRSNGPTSKSIA
jgi:cell division protein FtsW (lipid II flippase)